MSLAFPRLAAPLLTRQPNFMALQGGFHAEINGETIHIPDIAHTIEWAVGSPPLLHLFEETPVVKITEVRIPP